MIGDLLEHEVQIRLWIEAIQFGGLDQAVDGGGPLAAGVGRGLIVPWSR